MPRVHRLLAGTAWIYGAQLTTVTLQFGYAAVTSRTVDANGFGQYGVALAGAALVGLLATGGLAQTVARMLTIDPARLRAISLYGLILGGAGFGVVLAGASLWGQLWSAPGAAQPLRWLGISVLVAPLLGLGTGLLRREGRFRLLATIVLIGNLIGMAVGVGAVAHWATPSALVLSPVLAQLLTAVGTCSVNRKRLLGRARLGDARGDIAFSWRLTLASVLTYANGNVGRWAASKALGAAALGHWNRADVVTTVPFHQLQNAIVQAIYPEFRHDRRDGRRAREVWPDLLVLVAWVTVPAAAVAAVLLPVLIPVLFGPGWVLSGQLAVPLLLIAAIQAVSSVLSAAIEVLGRFWWIWGTQLALLVVYIGAAVAALVTRGWVPLIAGLFVGMIAQHGTHIILCRRSGYLALGPLLRGYASVVVVALSLAGLTMIVVRVLSPASLPAQLLGSVVVLVAAGALIYAARNRLPPIRIMREHSLI
ncbi:oligosaccharide flippase family protein [Cryobacterium sp. Y82]|uniref:oligosaccharide flippase family protein n=1 Tax=Cryobacterium sp. Y82 TaxID=2045017 RepID=UPI000CE312CF|nr:oligosaccharide flippase family protein [Cryobacterium sp. Y82]